MKPTWIRELDNIPDSIPDKLSGIGVHSMEDFMLKFGGDPEDCHDALEQTGFTDQEIIELVEAIWSQYLETPL